jgi:hypothetical protein
VDAAAASLNATRFSDITLVLGGATPNPTQTPTVPMPATAAVAGGAGQSAAASGDTTETEGTASASASASASAPVPVPVSVPVPVPVAMTTTTTTTAGPQQRLPAHKWLLRARSRLFQSLPLEELDTYALGEGVTPDLAAVLLRYLYTDQVDLQSMSDTFALRVLAISDVRRQQHRQT